VFWVGTVSSLIAQNKTNDSFYQKGGKLYSVGLEYVSGFDTSMETYSLKSEYGSILSKNLAFYGLLNLSTTNGFQVLNIDPNTQKNISREFWYRHFYCRNKIALCLHSWC
tara:strand:- start:229 stop:558 length:330 start_codon:yes stop_codon:yes gene_type:complete